MFFARWDMGAPWNSTGIDGTVRWLRRVWTIVTERSGPATASDETRKGLRRKVHQTLGQVTRDFQQFEFNTIVSALMELLNTMYSAREAGAVGTDEWAEAIDIYLHMLAPVCPHIAEELWTEKLGKPYSIHTQPWPKADEAAAEEEEITIPIQVNGRLRDRIVVPADATEEQIQSAALASEAVKKFLEGKPPKKVIVAQKKLVNIVV
jgi:leucyl-tRNA synthetase